MIDDLAHFFHLGVGLLELEVKALLTQVINYLLVKVYDVIHSENVSDVLPKFEKS